MSGIEIMMVVEDIQVCISYVAMKLPPTQLSVAVDPVA
jgi:hypothetical protein